MDELFEKLAGTISKEFSIAREQISMQSKLNADLGIDLDHMLDLADRIEKEYDVVMDLNEFLGANCVGDIVALIYQAQGNKGRG